MEETVDHDLKHQLHEESRSEVSELRPDNEPRTKSDYAFDPEREGQQLQLSELRG